MLIHPRQPPWQQPERFPLEVLAGFQVAMTFISLDPATNRARFYHLQWQSTLWGELALIQTWGRIRTVSGRRRVRLYPVRTHAHDAIIQIIRHRLRHGYQITAWD